MVFYVVYFLPSNNICVDFNILVFPMHGFNSFFLWIEVHLNAHILSYISLYPPFDNNENVFYFSLKQYVKCKPVFCIIVMI